MYIYRVEWLESSASNFNLEVELEKRQSHGKSKTTLTFFLNRVSSACGAIAEIDHSSFVGLK